MLCAFCVWQEGAEQSLLHSCPRNLFTRDKQEDAGESLPSSTLDWIPAKDWREIQKTSANTDTDWGQYFPWHYNCFKPAARESLLTASNWKSNKP